MCIFSHLITFFVFVFSASGHPHNFIIKPQQCDFCKSYYLSLLPVGCFITVKPKKFVKRIELNAAWTFLNERYKWMFFMCSYMCLMFVCWDVSSSSMYNFILFFSFFLDVARMCFLFFLISKWCIHALLMFTVFMGV